MVKRSIEQEIRNKNFGARSGNFEKNAVVKNQGTKQRVQRTLGECWHWETNGQCVKGDNCSFGHDVNKRAKTTQPNPSPNSLMQQNERNVSRTRSCSERMARCLARITSKELAPSHSVKSGTFQNVCSTRSRVVADLGKRAHTHTVSLMNIRLEGTKRMMTKVQ